MIINFLGVSFSFWSFEPNSTMNITFKRLTHSSLHGIPIFPFLFYCTKMIFLREKSLQFPCAFSLIWRPSLTTPIAGAARHFESSLITFSKAVKPSNQFTGHNAKQSRLALGTCFGPHLKRVINKLQHDARAPTVTYGRTLTAVDAAVQTSKAPLLSPPTL